MLQPDSNESVFSYLVSARLAIFSLSLHDALPISEVSGSNTPEVVLAVLEMLVVREESTLTTRVTDLLAPLVIVVRFHTRTRARRDPPQRAETKPVPAGMASDRLTPVASDGPLFVTVSV